MNAAIISLVTAFVLPLGNASLPPSPDVVQAADSQASPESRILEVAADELVQPDGRRVRWTSVTHELSTGQEAEAFMEVDDLGRGEALIYVDGLALMHVTTDEHGNETTWIAPDIDLQPETLAQLVSSDVATEVFAGIGEDALSGPCGKWGRVAKYAWNGIIGAAAVVCCAGVGTPTALAGCVACGALAGIASAAADDIEKDYCG
jgi:hypothetical protein